MGDHDRYYKVTTYVRAKNKTDAVAHVVNRQKVGVIVNHEAQRVSAEEAKSA